MPLRTHDSARSPPPQPTSRMRRDVVVSLLSLLVLLCFSSSCSDCFSNNPRHSLMNCIRTGFMARSGFLVGFHQSAPICENLCTSASVDPLRTEIRMNFRLTLNKAFDILNAAADRIFDSQLYKECPLTTTSRSKRKC
jgi:hypothetical protein